MLWTLETPSGQRVVCYAVSGDEGLAVTGEREGEIVLAEIVANMNAAMSRAEVVPANASRRRIYGMPAEVACESVG